MARDDAKRWGGLPRFHPLEGILIREPEANGPGYWAGAPTVYEDEGLYYLSYRIRRPRPERGVENRIALSDDGIHFEDIYVLHKSALRSDSIERCCLFRSDENRWCYAVSYVDPQDGRWRVDLLTADEPSQFDPQRRQPLFTAADIGVEGVNDPNVYQIGGLYWMLLSYAPPPKQAVDTQTMHATGDIYNTGVTRSHSGLATSPDGVNWTWQGEILSPSDDAWDSYAARLGTIAWTPPLFVGLYDGSRNVGENYEERCGLAVSFDLRRWEKVTSKAPWVTVPYGSGSVRYVDVIPYGERWRFYYEMSRPDGSHELRVADVPRR